MKTALSKNSWTLPFLAIAAIACGSAAPVRAQDTAASTGYTAPLPAGIMPGSPLAQVVKLAKADVDEALIQTYVSNSASTFNLDSDKIIYLKDAGVPNDLVTQMIQHDAAVQAQLPTVSAPPASDTTAPPADPNAPPPQPVVPPDNTVPPDAANAPQPPPLDATPDDSSAPPPEPVTLNNFYDDLSPYGNWVQVDGYGRCWAPGVANYNPDWQPYGDHGHWIYTDSGWYWESDYAWGWGPFHYGRWFHHNHLGWCWSPDTVWGPSWVIWRCSDDYYGWAPLPPGAYYQAGVGFMYNGGLVAANFDFGLSADSYLFVGVQNFYDPHPGRHRVGRGSVNQVFGQTTPVNGLTRNSHGFANLGISPTRVTQATHTPITTVSLQPTGGGSSRVPPNHVTGPRSAGYGMRPPSGYLKTENGTVYAGEPAVRNNFAPAMPQQQRPEPPSEYPPRQEMHPRPMPEEQVRPTAPPVREERPAEPAHNYAPLQPSKPAPSSPQKQPPH